MDIITYCQKGEEINDVIGTEFDIIWNEYVEAEEGTLHSSGLKLKDTFTKLIHRRKITA